MGFDVNLSDWWQTLPLSQSKRKITNNTSSDQASRLKMEKENLIGKHLLVGITFLDSEDNVLELLQTHGKIVSVDDGRGIIIDRLDGGGQYNLPPDVNNIYPAEPGHYTLKTTGEVVVDPDFTATWIVYRDGAQ